MDKQKQEYEVHLNGELDDREVPVNSKRQAVKDAKKLYKKYKGKTLENGEPVRVYIDKWDWTEPTLTSSENYEIVGYWTVNCDNKKFELSDYISMH